MAEKTIFQRRGTTYFEAVLQVRHADRAQMNAVRAAIARFEAKGLLITREVQLPEGIDFYLTDQRYTQAVGKELHRRFGGDLKVTVRLFTKDSLTSKDVYRVTVLLRVPTIKTGQIIEKGNKRLKVVHIGKKAHLVDLKTGKGVTIEYSKLK